MNLEKTFASVCIDQAMPGLSGISASVGSFSKWPFDFTAFNESFFENQSMIKPYGFNHFFLQHLFYFLPVIFFNNQLQVFKAFARITVRGAGRELKVQFVIGVHPAPELGKPVRWVNSMACGDEFIPFIVLDVFIRQVFIQWFVEVNDASVGQAFNCQCKNRFGNGGCFQTGFVLLPFSPVMELRTPYVL